MAKKEAKPREEFVLDGSVALSWCFPDEANPYANKVAGRLSRAKAIVPGIWPLEIANALLMAERRKRSTEAQTTKWLQFVSAIFLEIEYTEPNNAWNDIVQLARTHNLTAYDAAYLELALRRSLPLATLDKQLITALQAVGGKLYAKV